MNVQSKEQIVKTSRQQQAEERREHLVDTALTLFSQQGYEATSVKQIAAAAGVAMGLLYHYFSSKSDVLKAVWERHSFLPELRALLLVERDETAPRVLLDVAQGFSALLDRKEAMFRLMVGESQSHPEVAARFQTGVEEGMALLVAYLEMRIAAGELRRHDPNLTARMLFGAVLTTHLARLPRPAWAELVEQLVQGILASQSPEQLLPEGR